MPLQRPPMTRPDADPDRQALDDMCRENRREYNRRETTALTMLVLIGGAVLYALLRVVFSG